MTTFFIIIGIILFLAVGILFIAFLNQTGRALVGSLFTVEDVELYFGSFLYDQEEKYFEVVIGRFKLFFAKNYRWFQGSSKFLDTRFLSIQKRIIVVGATCIAFIISSLLYYLVTELNFHKTIQIAAILFFVSSCINILTALLSRVYFIEDTIGTTVDNYFFFDQPQEEYQDEKQICCYTNVKFALEQEATEIFWLGVTYYNYGEFRKAIPLLRRSFENHDEKSDTALLLLECYLMIKEYEKAESLLEHLEEVNFNANNYYNLACLKAGLKKHDESIYFYNRAIALDNTNSSFFNNRGYTYNLLERYEEATSDFDIALQLNPNFAFAYNNRGFTKMKLGKLEEGMKDVEKSLEIIPKNSYAYRNLGIYHFEKKQYKIALSYFKKSYQLDKGTHLIREKIKETRISIEKLEEN